MQEKMVELLNILEQHLRAVMELDFGQIKYADAVLAMLTGIILAVFFLAKILRWWLLKILKRSRPRRKGSGYSKISEFKSGILIPLLLLVPKILLVALMAILLVALARPYLLTSTKTIKMAENRTRVDLIDVSGSMDSYFGSFEFQERQTKSEMAREALLKFLKMRQGKKDRTSLWAFSDEAMMIEDFVVDDELYYFEASYLWKQMVSAGRGGGTNLRRALALICQHVIEDRREQMTLFGKAEKKEKVALLMITDAAANEYPESELEALKKANIVPYLIFIKESPNSSGISSYDPTAQKLIDAVALHGGRCFDATNPQDLEEAYKEIDRLEAIKTKTEYLSKRMPVHRLLLALSIAGFLITLILGIVTEFFRGQRT